MAKIKRGRDLDKWHSSAPPAGEGRLRIIGGSMRGQQIRYSGDPVTRPMKDNVREALFNLIGGWVPGKTAFDLFAGTGAIGLEAISRGATGAILVERHFPTAKIIHENVESLHVQNLTIIESSDTFFWSRQFFDNSDSWPANPWAVFCSPPYSLYQEKPEELLQMIGKFKQSAPPGSLIVVESDSKFDPGTLPDSAEWRTRQYAPAQISVWRDELELDD